MSKASRFSLFARDRHPETASNTTTNTSQKLQKPPPEPPPIKRNKSLRASIFGRRKSLTSVKESPPPLPTSPPNGTSNGVPKPPAVVTGMPPGADVTKDAIAITVVENGSRSPSTSRYDPEAGDGEVSARVSNDGSRSRDTSAYSGDTDLGRTEKDSGKDMRRTVDEDAGGPTTSFLGSDAGKEIPAVDGPGLEPDSNPMLRENGIATSQVSEGLSNANPRQFFGKRPSSVAFDFSDRNSRPPSDNQSSRGSFQQRSPAAPSERRFSEPGSRPSSFRIIPPPQDYVIVLNKLQTACPTYHLQTIRSLNIHYRILCMVCRSHVPGERWVCSYCSLRFCPRCKAEFRKGKTHEQVVSRAKAEKWDRMALPAAPSQNGGPSRLPSGSMKPQERPRAMTRNSWTPGLPPPPPQQQRPMMPAQPRGVPPERLREMQRPHTSTINGTKTMKSGGAAGLPAGLAVRGTDFELGLDIVPTSRPASVSSRRRSIVGKIFN